MHSVIELRDLKLETVIGSYQPDDVVPEHHLLDLTLSIDPSHVLIARDGMDVVFDYDPLVADIERIAAEIQYETQEWLVSRIVSVCADIPEFIAGDFQAWLKRAGIKPIQIYPGSPWENGYNERFNGTLRREVLNAEWFSTLKQAQAVINRWLKQYNHVRPHQALNMKPPVPETALQGGT